MNSIAALLSGGVDSAVALSKYIETFPEHKTHITAYYLKIWLEDELAFLGECPWEEDLYYATKVTEQLGIPLSVIPLQHEYYEKVVSYTIEELQNGGTPSPDIFCNQRIKFGAFLEKIDDADLVLSGHYAQCYHNTNSNTTHLYQPLDSFKDQTYFLSHLSKEQLTKIYFPLHNLTKSQVREYASTHTLAPYSRKDSQGICFLGKIKYTDFVKHHMGTKEGNIIDKQTGKILGKHEGSWFYTIGQRSGLGLSGGPWYVSSKSFEENIVWVQHGSLLEQEVITSIPVEKIHWIHPNFIQYLPQQEDTLTNLQVKIRHGQEMTDATMQYFSHNNTGLVKLAQGDVGVAEGQFTVLYHKKECLGCARIKTQ